MTSLFTVNSYRNLYKWISNWSALLYRLYNVVVIVGRLCLRGYIAVIVCTRSYAVVKLLLYANRVFKL